MIDLRFERVSKRYRIRHEAERSETSPPFVRKLQNLRKRSEQFWAVRDVSFEVQRGETLGMIGPNGAGKSTILKLLSNITAPTSGEITINGRLSALIEVGTGFHPELTGRENVYLSGSILGMRRREIREKLNSIVDFAGVEQFIDTPVKRYSSGMYVRLGFSIAAHLNPDILLLDEVLAVGDASFQAKCFEKIGEMERAGKTIIFISHDLNAVGRLCDRVLLIQQGEVIASGLPLDVIAQYKGGGIRFVPSARQNSEEAGLFKAAEVTYLAFYNSKGDETSIFATGEPLLARLRYKSREQVQNVVFQIFFISSQDHRVKCQFSTGLNGERVDLEPGSGTLEFSCPEFGLLPGIYNIDATIESYSASGPVGLDWQYRCALIHVDKGKMVRGSFYAPHGWRFVKEESRDNEVVGEQSTSEHSSLV